MPDIHLSDSLLEKLKYFIEDNDPLRMSRNVRQVFFDYLKFQDGVPDKGFNSIIADVESVLDLLDAIVEDKNRGIKKA